MIAILKESLFEPVEETTLALFSLFEICADERHVLLTNPSWKRSARVGTWLAALPRRARAEAERVLDRSIAAKPMLPPGTPKVLVDDVRDCRWAERIPVLDVKTALRLMRTPLRILVENRFSDGTFVRKILGPANRKTLDLALREGWVEFEQGGGNTEMAKRIKEIEADFVALARLWLMFDSDAKFDGNEGAQVEPGDAASALEHTCKAVSTPWPLRYHMLERRNIESYLPSSVLAGGAHKLDELRDRAKREAYNQLVSSFSRLTATQRYFYNMKAGLLGDVTGDKTGNKRRPAGDVRDEYRKTGADLRDEHLPSLFQGLDRRDREALRRGFGGNVASLFQDRDGVVFVRDDDLQTEISRSERDRLVNSLFEGM